MAASCISPAPQQSLLVGVAASAGSQWGESSFTFRGQESLITLTFIVYWYGRRYFHLTKPTVHGGSQKSRTQLSTAQCFRSGCWFLGFFCLFVCLSFCILWSRICPNCACMQLFLVPCSLFAFCSSRRGMSGYKRCSTAAKGPGPSSAQSGSRTQAQCTFMNDFTSVSLKV